MDTQIHEYRERLEIMARINAISNLLVRAGVFTSEEYVEEIADALREIKAGFDDSASTG